ncbi:metallophosphoesterase [Leptolyngbya sp. NIES-2104]|uniref:metallophosphoesterase n=1 Tax=Leptolyngbya sp. NIES-2104 TaxID=1552121 RepID=UPI0006EC4CB3|nr:metallophosphoesterase [Leptolyngbya sp. NIES-2104]GAP94079.1 metallophosphoesterase [Leptolyngbya sp. NIES-2104]
MQPLFTQSVKVETLEITIDNLPPHLNGTKLVQLSDLHFDGKRLSDQVLQDAIEATNQAEPDFVVITGDFVTDDPKPIYELAKRLKQIDCRSGIYAILGNHDLHRRDSKETIVKALSQVDIKILWNEIAYPVGEGLALVGLADLWSTAYKRSSEVMAQLPADLPRIVLAHNPDCAESLQQYRVDLQLSGHSHGGQIIIPGILNASVTCAYLYRTLPRNLKHRISALKACYRVMKHWEWVKGFHQVGNNRLYVNRGLGTYFPGRLFCPPEVTVITLRSKSKLSENVTLKRTTEAI